MRRIRISTLLPALALLITGTLAGAAEDTVHHKLDVRIDPETSALEFTDEITLPADLVSENTTFKLNSVLTVRSLTPGIELSVIAEDAAAQDTGMDREDGDPESGDPRTSVSVNEYKISGLTPGEQADLRLAIEGTVNEQVRQMGEDYARGFSQSPGLIEQRGAYLAGSTQWIPQFGDALLTHDMTVSAPADWRTVSQGTRTRGETEGDRRIDGWSVDTPTEEVHLIAAAFTEYSRDAGAVTAMAFLRTPDDALANKYLETTAQYLEMYRSLVGPYPYTKFALVENFWETGYGMPSFTLLGEQIIRFPFILHSSYPHELLHNWWGNGVFVDFESGNWCEGLTAYMADHLVAEQRGIGDEYRRSILQRYTNYVKDSSDFPLTEFRSRYSASTEAIGYGKTAMTFDMLRERVGDEMFIRAFQKFYRDNQFKVASYADIREAFESVTEQDLDAFFTQWVEKTGAPELQLKDAKVKRSGDGYRVSFTLEQLQAGNAYALDVPVAIYSVDKATRHTVSLNRVRGQFDIDVADEPVKIEVDPTFNVFRRLHYAETPPALSQAFGADKVLIVLPSAAEGESRARYQALADIWGNERASNMQVIEDSALTELPADSAVWVLGDENIYRPAVVEALGIYDAEIASDNVRLGKTELDTGQHSVVVTARHPKNPSLAMVLVTMDRDEAAEGLARKLPHYGKYSYLAFAGAETDNAAKGQWPAVDSPLVAILSDKDTTAALDKRPALAELAPAFSGERMAAHVNVLASDEYEGRGVGTDGLEMAADYIAEKFKSYGLKPAGDDGSYFQTFTVKGPDGADVEVKNVIGAIAGKKEGWEKQSVVVSAHYDHLGFGWPDVREGMEGKIHNGADDNASGVSVMLELAEVMAGEAPDRAIVFVAFTAEEAGLLGARHYARSNAAYPAEQAIANLNMDTVGRLGDNKLYILGASSAREWPFVFMGATATTGVETEIVTTQLDSSDNTAFIEIGVPAVQIFSGTNSDYHRPSDTADKVDQAGMVKVATVMAEVTRYFAGREEPMAFKGEARTAAIPAQGAGDRPRRSASTGTVPDFTFGGNGVRIADVTEGSPAAAAGLVKGDIIVSLDGKDVADLPGYTNVLRGAKPGDSMKVSYLRDGETYDATMVLTAR